MAKYAFLYGGGEVRSLTLSAGNSRCQKVNRFENGLALMKTMFFFERRAGRFLKNMH